MNLAGYNIHVILYDSFAVSLIWWRADRLRPFKIPTRSSDFEKNLSTANFTVHQKPHKLISANMNNRYA
jgi:hypothetical protein